MAGENQQLLAVAREIQQRREVQKQRETTQVNRQRMAETIAKETGLPIQMVQENPERWLPMVKAKRDLDREKQIYPEGAQ